MITIKNRFTGDTLLIIDQVDLIGADLRQATLIGANLRYATLRHADLIGADLSDADLSDADLSDADLSGATLSKADLSKATLRHANMSGANLRQATLIGADLSKATLRHADLSGANLSETNLSKADLRQSDLRHADLSGTNLSETNLSKANMSGAKLDPMESDRLRILCEGDLLVWKKCRDGVLVKLLIPSDARRSNATSRKCRAEYATTLEIFGNDQGISKYDPEVVYRVGETLRCDHWEEDRWIECGGGIHFFLTRSEAEEY